MFRLWGKMWHDNHLLRDMTFESDEKDTRTHLVFKGLDEICVNMDLQHPIWLDNNVKEFQKNGKTKFRKDSFTEDIEFDFLEIEIIEEGDY